MSEKNYYKPNEHELSDSLTDLEYDVTQNGGTEQPFDNAYWNLKEDGIYVDIVSGEPLFSSKDKFDSGTGWPSFHMPIHDEALIFISDTSHGMERVEVKSKIAESHLGHVFPDGPSEGGLRYCINSASLRFVPKTLLELEGYSVYLKQFEN
mgnify:CR=1 FL=1|tara:strand:- start:102 stop:554 length:453 start_codon:yes stop_codon:yes gene_type:complete